MRKLDNILTWLLGFSWMLSVLAAIDGTPWVAVMLVFAFGITWANIVFAKATKETDMSN